MVLEAVNREVNNAYESYCQYQKQYFGSKVLLISILILLLKVLPILIPIIL